MNKRKKFFLALQNHFSSTRKVALTGFFPLALFTTSGLAEETTSKWFCGADASGNWQCQEKSVEGKKFRRPFHDQVQKAPEDAGPDVRRARNLDWVDEEYLTDEQQTAMKNGCCGMYVEPTRDYPDADLNPEEASLRVAATTTEVMGDETAILGGGVQLTQGYRQVRGDSAMLDQQNRTAEIEGNVLFREPGLLVEGEKARINLDTRDIEVDNMTYVVHESGIRGTADRLTRQNQDQFFIENATYTTCEPASNAWILSSNKVRLNTGNGVGSARNVVVRVKGIPITYLPWIRFPLDDRRVSGLLYPHLEISDDNGLDYAQPIYLNLAPNYDATLTPRYVQERGSALELETRHLSTLTSTVVGGSFLGNDDGGDDPDDETRRYAGEDRWIATVDHQGGFGKSWRTEVDYTDVSDGDYFNDLDTATLETTSQTHLRQYGELGYQLGSWDFAVASLELEKLSDNPTADKEYKLQPRVTANGVYQLGNLNASLNNEFASFDHDEAVERNLPTGDRIHLDYQLSWDKRWIWGFFKPTVATHYLGYDLDNTPGEDSPSATIPIFSLDTGIYLERDTTWIGNFIQTFEPRLYALYVDFEDQSEFPEFDTTESTFSYNQLFRDNRFVGGDRIGDAEQVSIGLTTRLISANTGREVFRASLGQAYYMDDRQVFLKTTQPETLVEDESAYAGELTFYLGKNWQFSADALYDDNDGVLEKGNLFLRYQGNRDTLFNFGYRYSRRPERVVSGEVIDTDIDQGDISTYLPLFGNWNLIARWNYDFTNSRELETFAGIEYNSCCWRISLLARKWLDRNDNLLIPEQDLEEDNGIFLQIQLKGLGGTGKQVDNILSDGIIGYRDTHTRNNP